MMEDSNVCHVPGNMLGSICYPITAMRGKKRYPHSELGYHSGSLQGTDGPLRWGGENSLVKEQLMMVWAG